jgi:peptide subunit release factor 1 (eRF1)
MQRAITLVENASERANRHLQLSRDRHETARTIESRGTRIQDANAIWWRLQHLYQMEALVLWAMVVVEAIGVDKEPVLMSPSIS